MRVRKAAKSDHWLRWPVSMEQICIRCPGFHEILYLSGFLLKSVGSIQVWLKSDENNRYFIWRLTYIWLFQLLALPRLTSTVIDKDTNRISSPLFHHAVYMMQTKDNKNGQLCLMFTADIWYEDYEYTYKMRKKYISQKWQNTLSGKRSEVMYDW